MNKKIFKQEKEYLNGVLKIIDKKKIQNTKKIEKNQTEIQNAKKYFTTYYYEINNDELSNINLQIENFEQQNSVLSNENIRLTKQKKNPYFGRFDFQEKGNETPQQFYIGLGAIQNDNQNYVYDWRADICSLYYDDSLGKTSYSCQDGTVEGDLKLRRQFKIENGNLSYYLDSKMLIDDDILMEQLSQNATSKMHEIVSTIQKEQNILIRSDDFSNTIVQGVAGSGKTSVAMHRVSYLLYKYRKTLKNEDILILSPNELFSDYLSEVLPSLGEDKSFTITFSSLAKRLLGQDFETREQMLERVISNQSQKDFENIAIKSSFEFLNDLKKFLKQDLCNLFIPKPLVFGNVVISKEELEDIFFEKMKNLSIYKRIDVLSEYITEKFRLSQNSRADLQKRAKKILYNKFVTNDLLKIYNLFLGSVGLEEIQNISAYDIAPILLIKENMFGLKHNFDAKYVIIDEMQDYTPCHFYLFNKIWDCGKLFLGDINQSIDRTLPESYLINLAKSTNSKIKYLSRSYRSTMQISLLSQKILGKHIANNVNRNGEEVEFFRTKNPAKKIEEIVTNYEKTHSGQSIAIMCKTTDEIKFKELNKGKINSKKIITTPALAKGVEFDCVIVPFANEATYHNELDRNLLYVSSTRALHKLFFISDKTPTHFLKKKSKVNKS